MTILSEDEISQIEDLLDRAIREIRPEERERLREIAGKARAALTLDRAIQEILEALRRIEGKIDRIAAPARAAALPDRLRRTMMTLIELDEASASQVAEKTGRTRVAESAALNELVRLGFAEKRKVGRTVYFRPLL